MAGGANRGSVAGLSRQKLSSILFWSIASASACLLLFLALVLAGVVPVDPASGPSATEPDAAPEPTPTTTAREPRPATSTATTTERTPAPAATIVVVTASRGDSWFSARLGSENGRVLDERVLAQGESVRFRGTKIWLSIGASGNVDVTVDGEPTTLPPGTVSVVLTRSQATES